MRRFHVYTIVLIFCLSVLLIINIGTRYTDKAYCLTSIKSRSRIIIKVEDGEIYTQQIPIVLNDGTHGSTDMDNMPVMTNGSHSHGQDKKNIHTNTHNETHSLTYITNVLLEKARSKIKYDTSNHNFSEYGGHGLEDLVIESGGQPLRSLVISTWRSGSAFTGELIKNARPSTYYQYEPLFKNEAKQFRTSVEATEALNTVKQMLKCNYQGFRDYFECERKLYREGEPSTRMWEYCKYENNDDLCFNADFVSQLCRLFPFQTMKLVRLRLLLVEEILNDKALNVKVILLVRDPRGVMQSRRHHRFCQLSPDCRDHFMLCADMVSDYVAAGRLLQQYPDRLMVMRFEELALQLNITTHKILKFLKTQRTKEFDDFLQLHTNVDAAGAHSTSRVSSNVPYKWRTALNFTYVNEIQKECRLAMRLWGYKMAHNETHMTSTDFNPVDEYTISQ